MVEKVGADGRESDDVFFHGFPKTVGAFPLRSYVFFSFILDPVANSGV